MTKSMFLATIFIMNMVIILGLGTTNGDKSTVLGQLKIEEPTGKPIEGMLISLFTINGNPPDLDTEWFTDDSGMVNVTIPENSNFGLKGRKYPEFQDLYIYGSSRNFDFQYTTFMGSRLQAQLLANVISVPYNVSNGYIVLGMDFLEDVTKGYTPSNLKPAIGTSAYIAGIKSSPPVIFDPRVEQGNSVLPHGSSFITWPDVASGTSGQVRIQPAANQQCFVSPGLTSTATAQPIYAFPDSVTVVSYICSNR